MSSKEDNVGQLYTGPGFSLRVTDLAVRKLESIPDLRNETGYLRILVRGGGCSGFRQESKIDTAQTSDIVLVVGHIARVVVDPQSAAILDGALLDLEETPLASRLVLTNHRAQHACGCGESFSLS